MSTDNTDKSAENGANRSEGMSEVLIEICTDSVEGVLAARVGGAHRVELCSSLIEGGITPSAGTIELAVKRGGLPVMVMIRPRGGDFCYSTVELDVLRSDIAMSKALGVAGVVLGVLEPNGRIDRAHTRELAALARPLQVTFHRAFDMARDAFEALDDLMELGIERVLTSGQERSVIEGLETLGKLVARARGRISVMPGGGITERNVGKVVADLGVREVHLTGRSMVESRMIHRNTRCFMGGELRPPEFAWGETDANRVRAIMKILRKE